MNGIELIAAERDRQKNVEGWTEEHDEQHRRFELASAAACYATPPEYRLSYPKSPPFSWPWEADWWKPTPRDRIRELAKAGALVAAEIDRLMREGAP